MTDNKELLTPEDEQLLQQFFTEHKQAIPDQGFTRRVMRRLPLRTLLFEKLWTTLCAVICVVMFFAMDGIHQVFRPLGAFFYHCWERLGQIPPVNLSLPNLYYTYVLATATLLVIVSYNLINDHR